MYIGKKIKELRKTKGLSLTGLAAKSGVQIATLSRIEHLKMSGTLESHMKIAKALDVDITQLYTDIIKEEDKISLKDGKSVSDVFVHNDNSSYEILTTNILSKKMMPILLKIDPRGQSNPEQNLGGTQKFIMVLQGRIAVKIGDKSFALSKYNTLYFDASVKHCFVNLSPSTAKVLCVATPVAL